MGNRKYLWIVLAILIWWGIFQWMIPSWEGAGRLYGQWVFRPVQAMRGGLLNSVPFSLGDLLYGGGLVVLVFAGIRALLRAHKGKEARRQWIRGLVRVFWMGMAGILLFFLGWGGNYYKPELRDYWNLPPVTASKAEAGFAYFRFLSEGMNRLAPQFSARPLPVLNRESRRLYGERTDLPWARSALKVKPSLLGSWLPYLGIQGYYNPFTGEAQVNARMPAPLIPFVVAHEMAHQAGIAAEGDANFLAYLICRSSQDEDFQYSAFLHLWLYTHRQLMSIDSARVRRERTSLHPQVLAHLDEIRDYQARYSGSLQRWSSRFYDRFLKWNRQSEGIRSYRLAGADAWAWENLPDSVRSARIMLP